uniref:DUF1674 domain-containing protein n=1 Tax=Candidatus Kentrum sp. DK TaxID=2126562 RepID=A0A450SRW8_9GAMM|nr:MAG: Protein of unknown function (DUF1674) [Candidatus Kentron sp. DK]
MTTEDPRIHPADRSPGGPDNRDRLVRKESLQTSLHTSDEGSAPVREIGGPPGPEPTRYGDWEKNGRCIDF